MARRHALLVLLGLASALQVARGADGGSKATAPGCDGEVTSLDLAPDGTLFVGGVFSQCAGTPASRIARYAPASGTWSALGAGTDANVYTVAVSGPHVYVGGNFTTAGGQPAAAIARWDTQTGSWSTLPPTGANGIAGIVYEIVVSGTDVYVGGDFDTTGGGLVIARNVARYDTLAQTWSPLGVGAANGTLGDVRALAVIGSDVYVGGEIVQAGGQGANGIARYDTALETWATLGSGASNGVNGSVLALAPAGSRVYVGGAFGSAGGLAGTQSIARYDRSVGWTALPDGGGGTNGAIYSLAFADGYAWAGGNFNNAAGRTAINVARYDPATGTWSSLGSGSSNGIGGVVRALAVQAGTVHAGGPISSAGGQPISAIARYHVATDTWIPFGSTVTSTSLASDANPSVVNATVALTASVAGSAPGGTVEFFDGSTVLAGCTAVALAGAGDTRTATCQTNQLRAGARTLRAHYLGDAANGESSAALAQTVEAPSVAIAPPTLPPAYRATPYSEQLQASASAGALLPFTFTVVAGALPPPLSLGSNGVVGGTPGTNGTYNFTVRASDASPAGVGGPFFAERAYTIVVASAATTTTLESNSNPVAVNATVTLTATVVGTAPGGTVAFRDGSSAIAGCTAVALGGSGNTRTASCATNALPAGTRALSAIYSGDLDNHASTSPVLQQEVTPPAIGIAPAVLPNARTGIPYSQTLVASGAGSVGPYSFAITSGQPPAGLVLASNGQLTGTPTQIGESIFTVTASDSSSAAIGGPFSGQRTYTVSTTLQPTTTTISSIAPSPAMQGQLYTVSVIVSAAGGTPVGSASVADGVGSSCAITLSAGAGSCQMASNVAGQRTITASYFGQGVYASSEGTATLQVDPTSTGTTSRVMVGTRAGVRGQTLALPVSFRGDGTTVQFNAQITFDKDQLDFREAQPIGGAICNRLLPPNDDRIAVQAPGTPTGQPLSPNLDTRYCELTFRIKATTPGGTYPLGVVTSQCQDGAGVNRTCLVTNGAISVSAVETSVPNASLLAIAGHESATSASRTVRVTNRGDVALAIDCGLSGSPAFSLARGASLSLAPLQAGTIEVDCALPPLGSSSTGQLLCTTSDAVRPVLQYGLTCDRVPDGTPLPDDQIFDDGLKAGDQLGTSTAVSTAGGGAEVLVVGAPFAGGDANGRVLVMESVPGPGGFGAKAPHASHAPAAFRVVAELAAPPRARPKGNTQIGDKFGQAAAVSRDGSRIAIGAPLGGANGAGQVLIYERPAGGWQDVDLSAPLATLDAPLVPGAVVTEFGASLAFTADGDLAIGAPGTASGVAGVGAAFLYDASGSGYTQSEVLRSTTPQGQGRFGAALDLVVDASGNGRLVIGAPQEGALGPLEQRPGGAHVFPIGGGAVGVPQRILPGDSALGDKFGSSVAVREGIVVIGAQGDDTSAGVDSGSATVFRPRAGDGGIDPVTTLLPAPGDAQGAGAAVATNGDVVLVGAPLATVGGTGARGRVYLYDVEPSYASAETPLQTLDNRDGRANDQFGRAVAANARHLVAGVPLDDREIAPGTQIDDVGRADPFVLDRIFRSDLE